MKKVLWASLLLMLAATATFADCTVDQWKIDLDLVTQYMAATPRNYLAAVNLHRKWLDYAKTDQAKVKEITGWETPSQEISSSLNNVYRDAAQFIVTSYQDFIAKDPLKAAELGISIQKFFRDNPVVAKEFAAANQTSAHQMKLTLNQSIRAGFMEVYKSMASEYSKLIKEGKTAEAATLSANWDKVIADLQANGSPLPAEFQKFTGVDIVGAVDTVRAFEKDLAEYKAALAAGNFDQAFALAKKWEEYCTANPRQAQALNYFFNAADGARAKDKTDWKEAFQNIRLEIYQAMFQADCRAYAALIAEGKIAEAKKLLEKWQKLIDSPEGGKIAAKLGTDVKGAQDFLAKTFKTLDSVDPAFTSENVASFKKDLEEYYGHEKTVMTTVPGSDEWYNALTKGVALADKWSQIAAQNPALAEEVRKATGISLPQDSDRVIKNGLDAALQDSALKFNDALGKGQYDVARNWVVAWKKYLAEHPRVKELAVEKWGQSFLDTLDRYEKGLTIMMGDGNAATTGTSEGATTETSTGTGDSPVGTTTIQTTPTTGLGASGQ